MQLQNRCPQAFIICELIQGSVQLWNRCTQAFISIKSRLGSVQLWSSCTQSLMICNSKQVSAQLWSRCHLAFIICESKQGSVQLRNVSPDLFLTLPTKLASLTLRWGRMSRTFGSTWEKGRRVSYFSWRSLRKSRPWCNAWYWYCVWVFAISKKWEEKIANGLSDAHC